MPTVRVVCICKVYSLLTSTSLSANRCAAILQSEQRPTSHLRVDVCKFCNAAYRFYRGDLLCLQLFQYPGTYFYYRWRNNQKAKIWDAFTEEEKDNYRTTTTDEGNKR